MKRILSGRSLVTKVVAVGVAFAAVGGVAYAASSNAFVASDGSITGCAPANGGQVHIWKPGHRCTGGWVGVAFAANGAVGPAGPAGPAGPTGATGPANTAATTVDGQTVTKLALKEPTPGSGSATGTLYAANGLTILAVCDSSGNASLQANGPASADAQLTVSGNDNSGAFGSQTATLGATSLAPLGAGNAGETSFTYVNNSGVTVSGNIGYEKASSVGGFAGCSFYGEVISG
jgi:hypothetical protein